MRLNELIARKLRRSGQLHEAMAQTLGLDDGGLMVIDLHGTDVAMPEATFVQKHGNQR